MRLTACFALLAAGGCAALEESESTQDIVSAAAPYRYDSPYSIVPDLGVSGTQDSDGTATDAASIHEATFGNGVTSKGSGATNATDWHKIAAGGPGGSWTQFESAAGFGAQLGSAESDADTNVNADDKQLAQLESDLEKFPLPLHTSHWTTPYFFGWPAVQARWLRRQWFTTNKTTGLVTNETYADPSFGNEIRDRGARLYCAARAAAFTQAATDQASMGRQAALTVSILGHEIRLGVVEPTFRIDVPQKHTSAAGVQTFEVPFQVGAQITPIEGLGLPGFPELRYPVALVTGDTEVASALPAQSLHTSDSFMCSPFRGCWTVPVYSNVSPKDYLTVTHADAVRGRSAHLDTHTDNVPLFSLGAFVVYFHAGGSIDVGAPTTATPPDDRLLDRAHVPSWWPQTSRSGDQTKSPWPGLVYDSEPWVPTTSIDGTPGATSSFSLPAVTNQVQFDKSNPLLMRTLEDDDHHLQTATSVGINGAVGGEFPFDIGIASFVLKGEGLLGVTGGVQMDIRDGELTRTVLPAAGSYVPPPALPFSAVTATPSSFATTSLNLHVWLHVHIDLFVGSIDEDIDFINKTAEHTWGNAPWDQPNRALIATGSQYYDPRIQPWAVSHLPYSGALSSSYPVYPVFNSFDQSVDACLADPATPPPLPDPCPAPAPSGPIKGNLCVFSGSMQRGRGTPASWVGVCAGYPASIPAHVDAILGGAPASQKQCYIDMLDELCRPTSLEQDWNGQHGVAQIIDMANPANALEIGKLAGECATAFAPADPTSTFNRTFEFGVCDDSAKMYDPSTLFVPESPPDGTPSPVDAGTCKKAP